MRAVAEQLPAQNLSVDSPAIGHVSWGNLQVGREERLPGEHAPVPPIIHWIHFWAIIDFMVYQIDISFVNIYFWIGDI